MAPGCRVIKTNYRKNKLSWTIDCPAKEDGALARRIVGDVKFGKDGFKGTAQESVGADFSLTIMHSIRGERIGDCESGR